MPASSPATTSRSARTRIDVLLPTWNGERYLPEQLDSIGRQHVDAEVRVHVHDDASGDDSVALARGHDLTPNVTAHRENLGVVGNVERGLEAWCRGDGDYLALADQDDRWHPDRLAVGLDAMRTLEGRHGRDLPLLVHSDLRMVDARGEELAPSFLGFRRYATSGRRHLPTMLGQCGVMGNTCLMNRALVRRILPFPSALHVHDWWIGLNAELFGERVLVERALVDYRIHASNVSNSVAGLDGGAGRMTLQRLRDRDFRLPFREDSRAAVLQSLLDADAERPTLTAADRRVIERFLDYATGERGRLRGLHALLGGGFARPGIGHRARIALVALTTARYAPGSVRSPR